MCIRDSPQLDPPFLSLLVSGGHTQIVWEYNYGTNNSFIARAQKYSMDYLNNGFPNYVLGDVNFDDTINIMDVMITSDMFTGHGYLPTPPADYNQDGSVDQTDIVLLLNQILY